MAMAEAAQAIVQVWAAAVQSFALSARTLARVEVDGWIASSID